MLLFSSRRFTHCSRTSAQKSLVLKFERDSVNDVFICTGESTSRPRIVPGIYRLLTSSKLDKLCYRAHLISTNKWKLDF
jgi:hypothetical protein